MYINFNLLKAKKISLKDYFMLLIIYNNVNGEALEELIGNLSSLSYSNLNERSLITHVKQKTKNEHLYKSLRLSKKGKELINEVSTADLEEGDIKLIEYLINLYKEIDKPIGSIKNIQKLIPWFRVSTQYSRKMIYMAIKYYLSKESEKSQGKYITSLENLLWKPPNVFSSKWDLAYSKLFKFIQENKAELNAYISSKK